MQEIIAILEEYQNNNKYISCLEQIYVLFEKCNLSYNDRINILKQINDYNQKLYKEEYKKFQELQIDSGKNFLPVVKEEEIIEKSVLKVNNPLIIDVTSYLLEIKNASTLDEIINCLPKKEEVNYENIINSILIKLYKEKVEIINFIKQYNKEEYTDVFDEDLMMLDFKIETILDYKNEAIIEEVFEANNEIVFLKNSSFEPVIFQNLKGYEEYYESFLELLNSIIDGVFKRKKYLGNNNKLINMYEVKNFKTRILFTRLKDNIYVVHSAFVKKCDSDLRIRNFIENSSQKFQCQKDFMLSKIDDVEYIKQEQMYLEQLIDMLNGKVKVKQYEVN